VGKAMAPLRVWTIQDEGYSKSEIGLDEAAMHMLKVNQGDLLWVRNPNWFINQVLSREEGIK